MKSVNQKIEVTNYPYGSLKTTAYFSIEFNPKKGFRSIFQTINPKTGRLNAEKKGVYNTVMWLEQNEVGFVTIHSLSFNESTQKKNDNCKQVSEMFDLFTPEQIKYIKTDLYSMLLVSVKSLVVYCGVDFEVSKELYNDKIKSIKLSEYTNTFDLVQLNAEKIENSKDKNYNPFKVTQLV